MTEINIFNKVPMRLLLAIDDFGKRNISHLVRKLKANVCYSSQIITWFEEKGLLTKKRKTGCSYTLHLTEKGKEAIKLIKEIKKLIK